MTSPASQDHDRKRYFESPLSCEKSGHSSYSVLLKREILVGRDRAIELAPFVGAGHILDAAAFDSHRR